MTGSSAARFVLLPRAPATVTVAAAVLSPVTLSVVLKVTELFDLELVPPLELSETEPDAPTAAPEIELPLPAVI